MGKYSHLMSFYKPFTVASLLCTKDTDRQFKPGRNQNLLTIVTRPKSSHYLPVLEAVSTRSSPLTSASEISRKKDGKNRQNESTKRRATMNSRGAYDEDEMLRRAIEESKEMGTLGKRMREDIEE